MHIHNVTCHTYDSMNFECILLLDELNKKKAPELSWVAKSADSEVEGSWCSCLVLAGAECCSKAGFLSCNTVVILTRYFFVVGRYSVHCSMFSGILGLFPLDASSTPCVMTTKNVSIYCQIPQGDRIALLENHCSIVTVFAAVTSLLGQCFYSRSTSIEIL